MPALYTSMSADKKGKQKQVPRPQCSCNLLRGRLGLFRRTSRTLHPRPRDEDLKREVCGQSTRFSCNLCTLTVRILRKEGFVGPETILATRPALLELSVGLSLYVVLGLIQSKEGWRTIPSVVEESEWQDQRPYEDFGNCCAAGGCPTTCEATPSPVAGECRASTP